MVVTPEGKRHTLILVTIEHKYTYTSRRGEVLSGVSPYAKLELSKGIIGVPGNSSVP